MKRVAVIGVGRVGLPFALALAEKGLHVIGIDLNEHLLAQIRAKRPPFMEEGCKEYLERYVGRGFDVTSDISAVVDTDYIIVTVGTPVDENLNPVLGDLLNVVSEIAPKLRKGQTIVLRSTVSPGTTYRVAKYIERESGLKVGKEIFLATCPERIAEGRAFVELKTTPQIVGGVNPESTKRAAELFQKLSPQILTTDALSAEIAKLFTNMFRYIQFAIANEFFMIAEHYGRNYTEIRSLVNTGYSRGGLAGAGLAAGPCLYKDGFFLLDSVPYTELITNSWRINENLPNFLVERMSARTKLDGARVAVLGMGFKADTDDTRQSLSFRLVKALRARGSEVVAHDPYVVGCSDVDIQALIDKSDVLFIAVPHQPYRDVLPTLLAGKNVWICDVWGICGYSKAVFKGTDLPPMPTREVGS